MSDSPSRGPASTIAVVVVVGVTLVFAPLIASIAENEWLGTDYVFEFFDRVGLADPLDVIYCPLYEFFN